MPAPRLEGQPWDVIASKLQQWIEVATSILDLQSEALALDLEGNDITGVGAIYVTVTTPSGSTTVEAGDNILIVTSPGTVTLPPANTSKGRKLTIKNASGGIVTILPSSGGTIDLVASYPLSLPYETATVVSDGTQWWVI